MNAESPRNFFAPETPFLKRLGYGCGVGIYHLDRTPVTGRSPKSPWAIKKVLRTHKNIGNYGKLLREEAALLRQLNHPNIVGFRGFTKTEDGREVLAMEECTVSLGDMIEERREKNVGMFNDKEIRLVCLNISKALDYLHNDVMLMHGDIKSYNILLNGDFKAVKLCDFGVSVKVDKNGKALGIYIGTKLWSAPEVLNDEKEVTTKADIFSLGLVIYEMIALNPPHTDTEETSYSDDIGLMEDEDFNDDDDYEENLGKRPNLPFDILGKEYTVILKIYNSCTEQEPDKRPSAVELIKILEAYIK